jgi:hypothetical protein
MNIRKRPVCPDSRPDSRKSLVSLSRSKPLSFREKTNVGARQVFVSERDGHGAEYNLRVSRGFGSEVAGEGEIVVSVDDGKIRLKFC